MADEILPGLWVGGISDALAWNGANIYVHEAYWPDKPAHTEWIPILSGPAKADTNQLDFVASRIDCYLNNGQLVLVNCQFGIERSPLAIVWYISKRYNVTIPDAYAFVKSKHWMTANRSGWLS